MVKKVEIINAPKLDHLFSYIRDSEIRSYQCRKLHIL